MKNFAPHRKFRGATTIQPTVRPFYQHPWPEDIPSQCQICGTKFSLGWNLRVGPNRIGRFLKKAAYIGFLPCLFGPFLLAFLLPDMIKDLLPGDAWGWLFVGMFFAPLMFVSLSFFMPISRHVACKKCGWNHDYPPLKMKRDQPEKDSI